MRYTRTKTLKSRGCVRTSSSIEKISVKALTGKANSTEIVIGRKSLQAHVIGAVDVNFDVFKIPQLSNKILLGIAIKKPY